MHQYLVTEKQDFMQLKHKYPNALYLYMTGFLLLKNHSFPYLSALLVIID